MWSVHTAVNMERIGIPTVTVASRAFAIMGRITARALGFGSLPIVTVPHPFNELTEVEVKKIAESIVAQTIHALTQPIENIERERNNN